MSRFSLHGWNRAKIMTLACAGLLVAGCSSNLKPTHASLKKGLDLYFADHDECLFPKGIRFPYEVSPGKDARVMEKKMHAMKDAGLLKELKDLTIGQGEMLFKLINRETKNNAYTIIKEMKGGVTAWFYQVVGKRYGYDLKENYDPERERLIEMIIREMGPSYNV